MGRRRTMVEGIAMAGTGVALLAGRRARAGRERDGVYDVPAERTEAGRIGAAYGGLPAVFHRADSFQTYHTADYDAVVAALPTPELYPVRLPGGRAIVLIGAIEYGDITAHGVEGLAALPYGEVMVAAAVTRRPAPPFVPLFAPRGTGMAAGGFILQLPVTTRVARDIGVLGFGYPKFVADMAFDDGITEKSVRVAETGRDLLELRVRPGGRPSIVHETIALYAAKDGQLFEQVVPSRGIRQMRWGRGAGHVELGDHPVAEALRGLAIAPNGFAAVVMTAERVLFQKARPIGPARSFDAYVGEERELGRYIVRYPNATPIDRYAPFASTAGPTGTLGIATAQGAEPGAELAGVG